MRKTVCKRLRKMARDRSKPSAWIRLQNGQIVVVGYRGMYLALKRAYREGK